MAAASLAARTRRRAATRRLASSSVAPVPSGYERGWVGRYQLREFRQELACEARVSRAASAICSRGDR